MTYREAQPARSLAQLGLTLALLLASYMAGMAVSQRSISGGNAVCYRFVSFRGPTIYYSTRLRPSLIFPISSS